VARADDVHIFDRRVGPEQLYHNAIIPEANYHKGDICDAARLAELLQQVKPAVIFDLLSPPMFEFDLAYYIHAHQR